jgi:hypothetical protein
MEWSPQALDLHVDITYIHTQGTHGFIWLIRWPFMILVLVLYILTAWARMACCALQYLFIVFGG